jgi:hypothetical protein
MLHNNGVLKSNAAVLCVGYEKMKLQQTISLQLKVLLLKNKEHKA